MSQDSPYVVTSLRPETLAGGNGAGRLYQLTQNSVSPTRVAGVDADGFPVEETIPIMSSRKFVTTTGCINNVAVRTAVPFSSEPDAERYEAIVTKTKLAAGWLPLDVCPYTGQFKYATHTSSLVKVPPGGEDCGGKPDGCSHMREIIAARQLKAKAKSERKKVLSSSMTTEAAERMQKMTVEAFGQALGQHLGDPAKAKARMAAGKDSA